MRQPIVGVMGSGSRSGEPEAGKLGRWLAGLGVHLLTGGGGGVMTAVSRAFCEVRNRRGMSIGILPALEGQPSPPPDYPNPWIELVIQTHLPYSGARGQDPLSRNHINILSSDVIVALPGSFGTSSEVRLALEYARPIIALLQDRSQIPQLPEQVSIGDFDQVCRFVRSVLALDGFPGAQTDSGADF